jgi:DNA repair protein RecO (recombination protein O)
LRTAPARESDLVLVLLTPGRGRVDAIARGARKSRRRFPGGLFVGARGEATVAPGRGALARLDAFDLVGESAALGRDLEAFAYAGYLCELTEQLVAGPHPDPRLFAGLWGALDRCVRAAPEPSILRAYELALLDALGLLPTFGRCCVCGDVRASAERVAFDAERGGALCERHAERAPVEGVPAAVLDACEALARGDRDGLSAAGPGTRRGVRDLLLELLRRHLRRPLRSLELFAQLGAERPALRGPARS